jgi:hypothetical protein
MGGRLPNKIFEPRDRTPISTEAKKVHVTLLDVSPFFSLLRTLSSALCKVDLWPLRDPGLDTP